MPTLGMHALIGFAMGSQTKDKTKTLALIFGALIPDVDIIVAVISYFLPMGGDMYFSMSIHRSWSHSLVTISAILIIGLIVTQLFKGKDNNYVDYGVFLTFMAIGMFSHTIADFLYIGYYSREDATISGFNPGVMWFWPFTMERFALLPIEVDDIVYNFLITSDFLTDSLFLYFPLLYLAYKHDTSLKVRKPLLIISIVDAIIFTLFTIASLIVPISTADMIFYSYIPGVFDVLLVMIFPLLMHETMPFIYKPLIKKEST